MLPNRATHHILVLKKEKKVSYAAIKTNLHKPHKMGNLKLFLPRSQNVIFSPEPSSLCHLLQVKNYERKGKMFLE